MFANYSWYFRNALVRANYEDLSRRIFRTEKFLILFLSNLLLKGNFLLKNREMHILFDTVNDTVFSLIKQDNKITAKEISERLKMSLSTVRRKIKELRDNKKIERIGSDKAGHWKIIE